jgi:hypothetical protein
MALLKTGASPFDRPLFDEIVRLCDSQEPDGGWAFVPYDEKRHTWCVANAVWALADARRAMFSPEHYLQVVLEQQTNLRRLQRQTGAQRVALVALAGTVLALWLHIAGAFSAGWSLIRSGAAALTRAATANTATFVVTTVATVLGGLIVYFLTVRREHHH